MADGQVRVELGGVPETLLWTLYQRSKEARRGDAVLEDPRAVELVDRIAYPFEERFGGGEFGQWQALRARAFDMEVRRFLAERPGGTVVALGEGLETQFWRVDDGRVRWVSVDLPEVIDVRERLLGGDDAAADRRRTVAASALDERWMDELDPADGLLVTAQGLLMYLEPADVHGLIAACARRLPGATLVFDAVPAWLAARSRREGVRGPRGYQAPPWLWGMDAAEERRLAALDPAIAELRPLRLPHGRGVLFGALAPLAGAVGPLRRLMLTVYRMRFSPPAA